jgi:nucleotide-binding universal stress UspA family protein
MPETPLIKDIVVPLAGTADDEPRLVWAEAVAASFDGHVTGLQIHPMPEVIAITDPTGSAFLQSLLAESDAAARALAATLGERLRRLAVRNSLRRLDVYQANAGSEVAAAARTADVFVDVLPYADAVATAAVDETVMFTSGRACLFVPRGKAPPAALDTVLVGWKSTREAAHALAEAMPLLAKAREVIVALVEEAGASEQYGEEAGVDVGTYLSRHGITVEIRRIDGWTSVGEALVNEAARTGSDLLVMGAYGHSRLREYVLGGATRHVLGTAGIPVLVAH